MRRHLLTPQSNSDSNDEQAAVFVEAQPDLPESGRAMGLLPQSLAGFAVSNSDVPELPSADRSKGQSLPSLQSGFGVSGWRVGKAASECVAQLHAGVVRAVDCEL